MYLDNSIWRLPFPAFLLALSFWMIEIISYSVIDLQTYGSMNESAMSDRWRIVTKFENSEVRIENSKIFFQFMKLYPQQ